MTSDKYSLLSNCTLCPRNCGTDRLSQTYASQNDLSSVTGLGFCGQTAQIRLARAALHYWEEPCISGINGSGAVFFCGCNLKCVFCQNNDLAHSRLGKAVSVSRLSDIFLELQDQKAHNINLVTPGHFVPQIAEAIEKAKNHGLSIPVVYNTGSYEYPETLRILDGLIDIYMPDLKYMDSTLSASLSYAPDYFEHATRAIEEMHRQVKAPIFEEYFSTSSDPSSDVYPAPGTHSDSILLMKKGVLVRHLVLPKHTKDSRNILQYLYSTYADDIYISIMNQYTPMPGIETLASSYPELSHTLSTYSYEKVIDFALNLGITNAFIQEGPTYKDSFIPIWDYSGV